MSKLTIDPPDRRVSVTEGSQNRGDELAERLFRNLQSERKIASEIKEKIFLGDVLVGSLLGFVVGTWCYRLGSGVPDTVAKLE